MAEAVSSAADMSLGTDEYALQWAEIERLPTFDRLRTALFDKDGDRNSAENKPGKKMIDVTKLEAPQRQVFIDKLLKQIENDNLRLLRKIRGRIDKVGIQLPKVEVRYKNLSVEAECEVVYGKPLPTLWNSFKSMLDFARPWSSTSRQAKISIINDVSGIIKPGRMTLLLGPPGCGKTSFLKALSGIRGNSLDVTGEVSYNGYKLEEFLPQKTSAYVSQYDVHIPEMTVRETLDFSARCQGVGTRAELMSEISLREKQAGIVPDPDIDTYMKAISVKRLEENLQTDYILKILGLDVCADTIVGDTMRRGISGGQRKRLTTGEIIVGPIKTLFMDEITNGLDISTTFQIVACLQQLVHITDATMLVSLLQPSPETFDLFDDVILMAEGKIVYHGPRQSVPEFFQGCGFVCPERKAVADFLQEVISRKDQEQHWFHPEIPYNYVSVDMFCRKFKESPLGKKLDEDLSVPYEKSRSHQAALSFSVYSLSKWELFKACMSREFLLMKRNYFVYVFKSTQLVLFSFITYTVFFRTRMHVDLSHSNYYMGALYFSLYILAIDGLPEVALTVSRLAVFSKQKELSFYPGWAYTIPAAVIKLPLSIMVSLVWACLSYYVYGFTPEFGRFSGHLFMLFVAHVASLSMFRFVGSLCNTPVSAIAAASLLLLLLLLFSGVMISRLSLPKWLRWGFWVSPMTYGQIAVSVNEFLAPRWQKTPYGNSTIGRAVLDSHGVNFDGYIFWISVAALIGFTLLFNFAFALSLSFKSTKTSRAIISHEKLAQIQRTKDSSDGAYVEEKPRSSFPSTRKESTNGTIVLPFEPLAITFQDVQYYVDTPWVTEERGFAQKRLQLLHNITGTLRPGVLTALMGVSGAGKTTLLDVLAGRKTNGYIEGEIKINGYPKVQETFARISGYCEQTDIHSPQITVEESLLFSAWLRLDPQIDSKTKTEFVNDILETIELDGIKDSLVGIPGFSGLSLEQRKRLTIAVELVANPSIIFMDEPTTGLDARSAAIVMRAVKNVADTGRTITCTIHQPNTHIFEAFDALILLKSGGRIIYNGPLGQHSRNVIEYFESISGVPKIREKYNPATWILEITSPSAEAAFGVDFAQIYSDSALYENNKELVKQLSIPPPGSTDLHFPTSFAQNGWGQFKSSLWKQGLSYWRSPSYNLTRLLQTVFASLLFGAIYWNQGQELNNQQNLFNLLGGACCSVIFFGVSNCILVLPYVSMERSVMYRERFAGMYSPWAYAIAQVITEIPYVFTQTFIFVVITYPMIGYYGSANKIAWYFYAMFCTLSYYTYFGMMLIAVTPNLMVAAIVTTAASSMFNLFSGYFVPKPRVPKWWLWFYYLMPTSWTINGMLTSQYGDVQKEVLIFGRPKRLSAFLEDYFGFHHDQLAITGVVLAMFPIAFASLFAIFIGRLNFQKR